VKKTHTEYLRVKYFGKEPGGTPLTETGHDTKTVLEK